MQPLLESGNPLALRRGRSRAKIPDCGQLARLLRARRERPRSRRAAERDQQFPPSDGDRHTPLPCEVRKGKDTTPRACCPTPGTRAKRTPGTEYSKGGGRLSGVRACILTHSASLPI